MIVIIKNSMGNVGSIANMLKKIGEPSTITSDPELIEKADRFILPGVGSFDSGMKKIEELQIRGLLEQQVLRERKPILGLCLGMQIFGKRSDEGDLHGLGWIEAESHRFHFPPDTQQLPVPHMGWNVICPVAEHEIFANLGNNPRFYFVHSYFMTCKNTHNILATTSYGVNFPSIIFQDNIIGTQFHPEKSHRFGMTLLKNFSRLD